MRSGEGGDDHARWYPLRRVGREFAKNLFWMVVVFGALAAILVAATELPLVGTMAFVGTASAVMAGIVTGVAYWSGAREDTSPGGGHSYPGSPPDRGGDWPDGGFLMAGEALTAAVGEGKAAFALIFLTLIHRSAWKVNSANFSLTAFSEV